MPTKDQNISLEEKIKIATIESLEKSLTELFKRDGILIDSNALGVVILVPNDNAVKWYVTKVTKHVSPFIEGALNQMKMLSNGGGNEKKE